jgi:hypothetical protein
LHASTSSKPHREQVEIASRPDAKEWLELRSLGRETGGQVCLALVAPIQSSIVYQPLRMLEMPQVDVHRIASGAKWAGSASRHRADRAHRCELPSSSPALPGSIRRANRKFALATS